MGTCPLSKKDFRREVFAEAFAVTSNFMALQGIAAKIANIPIRAPIHLGLAVPLSYYALSALEHANYPDKTVHTSKHERERQLVILAFTMLIIRSYKETSYQIPYKWGFATLTVGYIGANLH